MSASSPALSISRVGRGLAVVALLALPLACGDDSAGGPGVDPGAPDPPQAQPSPNGTMFVEGDFDDIPVFRGATPVQGPTHKDGATTASYETKTATPARAVEFYAENLPALGWQVADPARETSDGVWRGDWVKDGRRLQVSALTFDAVPDDEVGPHTQFSLVLLDSTADIPVGASTLARDG